MIPCIENKCITWPICRNNEIISCQILNKYCIDEHSSDPGCVFEELNKNFPNLYSVFGDDKQIPHIDLVKMMACALSRRRTQLKYDNSMY
jgi:hypothetical protein